MSIIIPATTLYQPYASLIEVEAKPWETRDRAAPAKFIGRRMAIHAGINQTDMRAIFGARHPLERVITQRLKRYYDGPDLLPFGAVVATATLAGSYRVRAYDPETRQATIGSWIGGSRGGSRPTEAPYITTDDFGNYAPGRWLWWFTDVERVTPPVPARGYQYFWPWQDPRPGMNAGAARA